MRIKVKLSHSGEVENTKGVFYTLHKGSFEIDQIAFIGKNGAVLFADDKKEQVVNRHKDITSSTLESWVNDILSKGSKMSFKEYVKESTSNDFKKIYTNVTSKLEELEDMINGDDFLEFRTKKLREHNEMKKLISHLSALFEQNLSKK